MQITCACAEELHEAVQAAGDAVRGLEASTVVLRGPALGEEDRRREGQRYLDEAARLLGSARGIAERLGFWGAIHELRR